MAKKDRSNKMYEYITQYQNVTINQLAEIFEVSEMTVRRDIKMLEENQLVEMTDGIVSTKLFKTSGIPIEFRQDINFDEKVRIGREASSLVKDGETIIIDGGTTTYELALNLINKKNLTVIVNDFQTVNLLKSYADIEVFFMGGQVFSNANNIVSGYYTSLFLQNFSVNKVFLSALSINFNSGLFSNNLDVAQAKRSMVEVADEVIIMADHSKFDSFSKHRFASIDDVDIIITDKEVDYDKATPRIIVC